MSVQLNKPGEGGQLGKGFCSSRHPTREDAWCRRFPHSDDVPHAAYTHSISTPEEW